MKKKLLCACIISLNTFIALSQNQTNKWYFAFNAGLDFMTSPPTALTNGAMNTGEGCATMSDGNGNLMFYSDGVTVWNQNHVPMSNGTGLFGNISSSQGVIIEKQPGNSNIYYIFTVYGPYYIASRGVNYSIVDLSLSAGLGSVTVANAILSPTTTEHMTSTPHCNGIDTWIITHEHNSAQFKTFLLTASGVSSVAVISTAGAALSQLAFPGCMKVSPNGKKLALAVYHLGFYLFDFDNSTGTVSNALTLFANPGNRAYGVEFSPEGTKLYGTTDVVNTLDQWDLCAGSGSAIVTSKTTVFTGSIVMGGLQRASNGKIYVSRVNQTQLGVINAPDLSGSACNYVDLGTSIAPNTAYLGLPNFNFRYKNPATLFTYTTGSCSAANFSNTVTSPTVACLNVPTYSLLSQLWDFGDPTSGSANSSTLSNPTHIFSGSGSYTTRLILQYSCGGGTDTISQIVSITNTAVPTVSVSGGFTGCAGSNHTYIASGAITYSWSTGVVTQSLSVTPTVTTVYTVTGTGSAGCSSQKAFTVEVLPCVGIKELNMLSDKTILVFPNPTSGFVYVECTSHVNVYIINQQGQVILEQTFEAGSNKMNTETLSDGFYFLRTVSESHVTINRLLKKSE